MGGTQVASATVPRRASTHARRIVIADNDPDALDLLMLDLALEGHEIVGSAMQGDEAMDLVRRLRPDVLVVDMRMPPGPNGVEVAWRLRDVPGLTVVLYTNYTDPTIQAAARNAGAIFLTKGNLSALRALVAGAQ